MRVVMTETDAPANEDRNWRQNYVRDPSVSGLVRRELAQAREHHFCMGSSLGWKLRPLT